MVASSSGRSTTQDHAALHGRVSQGAGDVGPGGARCSRRQLTILRTQATARPVLLGAVHSHQRSFSRLAIEPGGQQAAAVIVAEIRPVVLQCSVPDRDVHDRSATGCSTRCRARWRCSSARSSRRRGTSADRRWRRSRSRHDWIVDVALVLQLLRDSAGRKGSCRGRGKASGWPERQRRRTYRG